MLIIEGFENAGKSTLARRIASRLGRTVQESEGPPRYAGEINERITRYARMPTTTLFVRHPCISQQIYGKFRPTGTEVDEQLMREFYDAKPLLIYCDPLDRPMEGQIVKDHDTPEHLQLLALRKVEMLREYREWALREAHLMYRIGDDVERIISAVAALA